MSRMTNIAGLAALALTAASNAGVITTSSRAAFDYYVGNRQLAAASFGFAAPVSPSAFLSGGTSFNAWTMTAASGDMQVANGRASAVNADTAVTILFSSANVRAVGGNFFMSGAGGLPVGQVRISLSNGQSYVANSSLSSFAGFISTESIASITIERQTAGADPQNASVGNLVVAGVPAPGSITLLGAVGLLGSRRRRR